MPLRQMQLPTQLAGQSYPNSPVNLQFQQGGVAQNPNIMYMDNQMFDSYKSSNMGQAQRGMPTSVAGSTGNPEQGWGSFLFGDNNQVGAIQGVAGLLGTGLNMYTGWKGLQMAEDQFNFQKDAFNKNYANQTKLINSQLRDRQQARYAANPHAYQKPDDYMKENKVGE